MRLFNTSASWGLAARLLHWAMAGVILYLIGLGVWMTYFTPDVMDQFGLVQLHKSWGFVAFALGLLRIIWKFATPAGPPPPPDMARWERVAAAGAHHLLYVFMFVMPLSGWLMASASELQDLYGIENMVFGAFALPDPFIPGDRGLEEVFGTIHLASAIGLSLILIGHAGAALKHHFLKGDDVLRRMTYGR